MNIYHGRARRALVVLALSLAACGGGGGGGTPAILPTPTPAPTPTAGPVGAMVSIPIHGAAPQLIAYQAGTSGAWTTLTAAGGSVSFTLPVGTTSYSIAALCPFNASLGGTLRQGGPAQLVIQVTTADSPTLWCNFGGLTMPNKNVNATAFVSTTVFPATDTVAVTQAFPGIVGGSGFGSATGGDAFGSPLWYPGASDVAIRVSTTTFPSTTLAARLVRNVTFAPNQTLTFAPISVTTDPVTTASIALQPTGNAGFYWVPAEGGSINVGFTNANPATVPLIPNATAGDYYYGQLFVSNGSFTQVTTSNASAFTFPTAPSAAFTITGTQLGDFCSINAPYSGFNVSGKQFYTADLSWTETTQPVAPGAPTEHVVASPSYLGTSTTVTVPDLSSVPGMLPKPSGGVLVYVLGEDWMYSNTPVWDNMEGGNILLASMLPNNSQVQMVQSNYFTYTAP